MTASSASFARGVIGPDPMRRSGRADLAPMRRLLPGTRLVVASHNSGKLAEIAALVRPHALAIVSAATLGLPEPEETAPDFLGNAQLKARAAATGAGLPALADDSGLCVAGLGGAPGPLSARWAGPTRDFDAAIRRIEAELGDNPDRRAWFISTLCLAWPDGASASFVGRVDGTLAFPARGENGFGYDPVFVPLGRQRTYGEMARAEKEAISHRARAFAQLVAACLPGRTGDEEG